ncbi:hypothetical protein EDC01DRAFT_632377 [Geopyxis carbonaria]|nr:hypothetical protein EDC01DRAFT_632377 [Geopyxis carbonaria]
MASLASPKRRRIDIDGHADGGVSRSSSTSTNDSAIDPPASATRRTPTNIFEPKTALKRTPPARSSQTGRTPLPPAPWVNSATRPTPTNGVGTKPPELKRLEGTVLPATRKRKPVDTSLVNGSSRTTRVGKVNSPKPPAKIAGRAITREKTDRHEEHKRALETRLKVMEMEIESLQAEVEVEKLRIEKEETQAKGLPDAKEAELEELIARLLSANDSSITSLPKKPKFDFEDALADPDVPSMLPLAADKPLKQLTAFHNITFLSTETTMLPNEEEGSPQQQHKIQGYAGDRLLYFQLVMVVDINDFTVQSLSCKVTPWTRPELSPFITRCSEQCNPSLLLYALNSYTNLTLLRAKVFSNLCAKYPGLLPGHCVNADRRSGTAAADTKHTRREIMSQVGNCILVFRNRAAVKSWRDKNVKKKGKRGPSVNPNAECATPEFVLRWKIVLSDEGDAQSKVDGEARVPSAWVRTDGNDHYLRRIPTMFQDLIKQHGITYAANCMVSLLYPDPKAL